MSEFNFATENADLDTSQAMARGFCSDERCTFTSRTIIDKQGLEPLASSRRNLLKGGLMAAATIPWIAGLTATAVSHPMYPRVGQRILAVENRVVGLGACHTSAPIREPSGDTQAGKVEGFSEELLARLLQISSHNGDGDPRYVRFNDSERLGPAVQKILDEETDTITRLKESQLYWVQTNPVFLYALGPAVTICLYPFVQGFSSQLGSRVADWLWEEVIKTEGTMCST